MSGQIVPGNRNGLTATQAYPGLGSILNTESTLINQSQRNNLQQQQQSQLNGTTRPPMSFQKPNNRLSPTGSRGFSPTDNFPPRLSLGGNLGDLDNSVFPGPWDKRPPNPFNLDNNDFPSLSRGMRDFQVRTPTSPTVTAPGRPPSISDTGLSHLGSPSPLANSLSSSIRPMMDLSLSSNPPQPPPPGSVQNQSGAQSGSLSQQQLAVQQQVQHPLTGAIPGLSSTLPGRNYISSLSKSNQDGTSFSIQDDQDFPALDNTPASLQPPVDKDPAASFREYDNDLRSSFEATLNSVPMPTVHNSRPINGVNQIKYDPTQQKLTNIPKSMLTDKYSFLGCLHVLEQIFDSQPKPPSSGTPSSQQGGAAAAGSPESSKSGNSNGVTPPPGVVITPPINQPVRRPHFPTFDKDLTKMGLVDGYSSVKDTRLIYRFQSPFANMPCRAQDIDMFVPSEYRTNALISDKLTVIKPSKWGEDLLFWMFYSNPNDHMQLTAADELYNRNWRFHKEKKIWISKTQNIKAREQNINYEEGTFHVWDVDSWKKVPKDMKVEYSKLEDKSPLHQARSL